MKKGKFLIFFILVFLFSCVPFASVSAERMTLSWIETSKTSGQNKLENLNVAFYGDSICAANRENRIGWAGRVGEKNQMKWVNHGQGGWAVSDCRGYDVTIFHQVSTTNIEQYDMILLHGGTNDAWDAAPLGKISDDFRPYHQYNTVTFAGGLERTIAYVLEKNPDAMVGYIINFKFIYAESGQTTTVDGERVYLLNHMEEYVEMTRQICEKWGIPCLDLYADDALTAKLHPADVTGRPSNKYLFDFIHPSPEGYDLLAPYVEAFMVDMVEARVLAEAQTTAEAETDVEVPLETLQQAHESESSSENNKSGCGAVALGAVGVQGGVALGVGMLICHRRRNKILFAKKERKGGLRL